MRSDLHLLLIKSVTLLPIKEKSYLELTYSAQNEVIQAVETGQLRLYFVMYNTKVIIFLESPICKTFLFECSRYWASEGHQVHYISKHTQEELPPTIQGIRPAQSEDSTYTEFMQITFITAPTAKDFIDYMINLRQAARLPKVLVVEDITSYEEDSSEAEFLLMCSFLKSTANFCSQAHDNTACVIISSKFETNILNKINFILLPKKIWRCFDDAVANENSLIKHYILREVSLNPVCKIFEEMSFSLLEKKDGKFVRLNSITRLFEEDNCNFNNVIK